MPKDTAKKNNPTDNDLFSITGTRAEKKTQHEAHLDALMGWMTADVILIEGIWPLETVDAALASPRYRHVMTEVTASILSSLPSRKDIPVYLLQHGGARIIDYGHRFSVQFPTNTEQVDKIVLGMTDPNLSLESIAAIVGRLAICKGGRAIRVLPSSLSNDTKTPLITSLYQGLAKYGLLDQDFLAGSDDADLMALQHGNLESHSLWNAPTNTLPFWRRDDLSIKRILMMGHLLAAKMPAPGSPFEMDRARNWPQWITKLQSRNAQIERLEASAGMAATRPSSTPAAAENTTSSPAASTGFSSLGKIT